MEQHLQQSKEIARFLGIENMGYYNIKLDDNAQKICTILFSWVKYKCKTSLIGIKITMILMFFKVSCPNLSKIWTILRLTKNLDDLLIVKNKGSKETY
jgi:hypothetical protein